MPFTLACKACALALVLAMASSLAGCGLRGNLYLPSEPEAQGRATLPQVLLPTPGPAPAASSANTETAPVRKAP